MKNSYAHKRIQRPGLYYETPSRILSDRGLTRDEKLAALRTMKRNTKLMRASGAHVQSPSARIETRHIDDAINALETGAIG